MQSIHGTTEYRAQIDTSVRNEWAGPLVVSRGKLYDTRELPFFVALSDGALARYLLHRIAADECEVLVLQSLLEGRGAGTALLQAVIAHAAAAGCGRVFLITTNDNTHAIRFYQKRRRTLAAVHLNAMQHARELKPAISLTGMDGIPILHEFEFVWRL